MVIGYLRDMEGDEKMKMLLLLCCAVIVICVQKMWTISLSRPLLCVE